MQGWSGPVRGVFASHPHLLVSQNILSCPYSPSQLCGAPAPQPRRALPLPRGPWLPRPHGHQGPRPSSPDSRATASSTETAWCRSSLPSSVPSNARYSTCSESLRPPTPPDQPSPYPTGGWGKKSPPRCAESGRHGCASPDSPHCRIVQRSGQPPSRMQALQHGRCSVEVHTGRARIARGRAGHGTGDAMVVGDALAAMRR